MPRDALFDQAVNRSAVYLERLGPLPEGAGPAEVAARIELWYLKTRFAYRVPLEEVVAALLARPADQPPGALEWAGGREGGWRAR
ncbi:MAG: hypothetical protein GX560_06260 [Deinococcales bacterium]|nr:hypothetical protein [Deinococcales bacterium]